MPSGSIIVELMMNTGSFETDTQRAAKSLKVLKNGLYEVKTETETLNVKFDSLTNTFRQVASVQNNMASSTQKSMAGFRNANQVITNTSYQITDFVVQVTGGVSAMRAFSQQAPQFLGAFGPTGAMLGVFAALAGAFAPIVMEAIKGAAALQTFDEASKHLETVLGQVTNMAQQFDMSGVIKQFNEADAVVRANIVNLMEYRRELINISAQQTGKALQEQLKDIVSPGFMQRATGSFGGNPLGLDPKIAQDFYAEVRSGATEASILADKYGKALLGGNKEAQALGETLFKAAQDTQAAANASSSLSKFLQQARTAGGTGLIPVEGGKTKAVKQDNTLEKMFNNQRVGADKFVESMQRANEQVEFQASLLGKSSQEVEILNAQYRIQAELEKTIQDIERQNGTLRADEFERMKSAAAEALAIQTNAIMARQEMERSASYGIERGMRSYAESAGNAAKGMESVFNGAFKGMENAMVQFVMTGKMNFGDMVNAMISDLVRFQMQMAIAGLAKMAISAFAAPTLTSGGAGSLPTGAKPLPGSTFAEGGYTGDGSKYQPAGVVHAGEFVMTKEATSRIGVGNLYRAMRGYADGGLVGSSPLAGGANGSDVIINIKNEAGGDGYQASATARKNENGLNIDVMVRKAVSSDLANNGPLSQQMTNTFGLRRAM